MLFCCMSRHNTAAHRWFEDSEDCEIWDFIKTTIHLGDRPPVLQSHSMYLDPPTGCLLIFLEAFQYIKSTRKSLLEGAGTFSLSLFCIFLLMTDWRPELLPVPHVGSKCGAKMAKIFFQMWICCDLVDLNEDIHAW